ncbi:PLP-dependent aminotransferase family protein [Mucilaginibacter sabulilitoris]|uniref:PLP-dependent aminotransferase family protein n=1 Tax=Mucilaginibacter sabulilitoris TaxID=1173583 RepID=A0ABZ0TPM8_9SPHI|nr:PLP-dependent aminotransferase family protein [Mucilaginibacter sabulilitoris]WPU94068.1 PLP-dependent aminotransferase family protein [Mucilaginibacter sabulilitoris]
MDKSVQTPIYLQIANSIINHIRQGKLKPGSALPGSRILAQNLAIHRQTVVAAYDELYAQNWVEIYPRRGIFVAQNLPDIAPRPLLTASGKGGSASKTYFDVDDHKIPYPLQFKPANNTNLIFNEGFPDTRLAPVELIVREYRRFANYHFTSKYLMYGPEHGSENLRTELAHFLGETRCLQVNPNHILITKGAQMALYLIAQILLSKGDTAIAADPGYLEANNVFEQAGAQVALAPVDECGIDLDAVEAICKKKRVKLVYVIPHHHRPTTVTLSAERRMRLLELARQYRFAIIEDDYDYDFHYSSGPILPLASADYYGSIIYIGSFCKTIAPGIRIGFMVAPPNMIMQATRLRRLIDRQGELLLEEAMANLLKNGDVSRHLKKTNKIYHERRDIFCSLLQEQLDGYISFKVPDGGFAVWINYLNGIKADEVAQKAAANGLTMSDGKSYYQEKGRPLHYARLGFASMNPKELETAVDILAASVKKLYQ